MRRTFFAVLTAVFLALSLSACGPEKTVCRLESFEKEVEISREGVKCRGILKYISPQEMVFTVTEPASLAGIRFVRSGGEDTMEGGECSFSAVAGGQNNPIRMMFVALSDLGSRDISLGKGRSDIDCEGGKAVFSAGGCEPESLDVGGVTVIFSPLSAQK
ncbi:MAG: hypothetical protein ACI4GB_07470 [Acutalibacteraceae bacterium]